MGLAPPWLGSPVLSSSASGGICAFMLVGLQPVPTQPRWIKSGLNLQGCPWVESLMRGTPWGGLGLFAFLPWSPCPPGQDTGGYHGVFQGSGGGCGCRHRKIWPVTGFLVWETHLPCPYIFRLFCNKVIHKVHTGVSCSIMCPWKLFLSIQMSSFLCSQWGIYVIFMRIIFYDELI